MPLDTADIGIIGGSGFYSLLQNVNEVDVDTPYGAPSDTLAIGEIYGKQIAFLARHGKRHQIPPHMINYRANIWAMKELGVRRIIAPIAVGSLQPQVKPGDFVISDQFIDRTNCRKDTYYDDSPVTHVSSADPFCPQLRVLADEVIRHLGIPVHAGGTNVVIQGPRFSSRAESLWFTQMGWTTINMTQYPEVILAIEQEMCYVSIGMVTDFDAGLVSEPGIKPVNAADAMTVLKQNNDRVRRVVIEMIRQMDVRQDEKCATTLKWARF